MKRILIGCLCASTLLTTALPVYAANVDDTAVTYHCWQPSYTTLPIRCGTVVQTYTLQVDGTPVDLGSLAITEQDEHLMIPLAPVAQALGFTLTWNGVTKSIHLDNGLTQSNLALEVDSYGVYSDQTDSISIARVLGAAPTIINGAVYVPVDCFSVLLMDENCVSIKDNTIDITLTRVYIDPIFEPVTDISTGSDTSTISDPAVDDTTDIAPDTNPVTDLEIMPTFSDDIPICAKPSPLIAYSTLDDARAAAGFDFAVPTSLPAGYQLTDIIVISGSTAELFYRSGEETIVYRTAQGDGDISGDYNVDTETGTVSISDLLVNTKGSNGQIRLATWTQDGIAFSLSFDVPVDQSALVDIIESIH